MSDTVRKKAEAALAEVEQVTKSLLPEPAPANALVPLAEAEPAVADDIRKRMDQIDMTDTGSIIAFGSTAQAELQTISQDMLSGSTC